MKIALDDAGGAFTVRSYADGEVRVRDRAYRSSVIVLAREILPQWEPRTLAELRPAHLQEIIERRPELVILGTGEAQQFPEPSLFAGLMDLGIGYEVMDNRAACRTFNVLVGEQRQVALALILSGKD